MLYIITILLGITTGILAKGSIKNACGIRLEKSLLFVGAFLIQLISQVIARKGFEWKPEYSIVIQGITYCLLFTAFWFNRYYTGVWIISAGCIMNALVVMANDGKMPVSTNALYNTGKTETIDLLNMGMDPKHIAADESTKLLFLGDIINLPDFINYYMYVVSIGDLIIAGGLFFLSFEIITGRNCKIGIKRHMTWLL